MTPRTEEGRFPARTGDLVVSLGKTRTPKGDRVSISACFLDFPPPLVIPIPNPKSPPAETTQ